MRIQDLNGVIKGIDPREARKTESSTERATPKSTQSDDGDSLDLSLSARVSELSTDIAETVTAPSDDLAADRAKEIQARVNSGFYDQPSTVAAVADRLLNFYGQ